MVTRRNALILGLAGPLLAACGGGGGSEGNSERVVQTPIPSDDWPTATPESQSVTTAAVNAMMASSDKLPALRSMLVVRNGMLVAERYFNGSLASDLQHVRSVTKTISSLLIGQAIQDGKIRGVSATLSELLPAELAQVPNSVAGNITLRQVLQMRSGMKRDDNAGPVLDTVANLTRMALELPATGKFVWNYDSAMSHLPSPIVALAYGEANALAVATRTLFLPLGIKQVAWDRDQSGAHFGSFGLQMRSRDMAKIGWMALDSGRWQGRTLVSPDWLTESMTDHAFIGNDGMLTGIGYGYLWWSGFLGGHRIWHALGHGGQMIMLVPELKMVVITTSNWLVPSGQAGENTRAANSVIANFLATFPPST